MTDISQAASNTSLSPTHRAIKTAQGNLHVEDFPGAEPAFVVLHGFPDNSKIYELLMPHLLQAGRRVIKIDFLGFGSSDKPVHAKYSFEQQLADVETTVTELGLSSIIPVGHDAGGPAAVNYTLRHPELTSAVVLLNSFYSDAPGLVVPEIMDFFSSKRLAAMHQYIAANPQHLAWLFDFQRGQMQVGLSESQIKVYDAFLGPIVDENFSHGALPAFISMTSQLHDELASKTARLASLRKSKIPFTFVWGKYDSYLHLSTARWLQSQLQNSTLHTLDAGHWPQIDAPAETAKIMLSV